MREDRDSVNANANLLMTKFRQTASELHEVREDREGLKKEVSDLKDLLENFERHGGSARTSNILQTNSVIVKSRPPLGLLKSEILNSPIVPFRNGDSTRKPTAFYS